MKKKKKTLSIVLIFKVRNSRSNLFYCSANSVCHKEISSLRVRNVSWLDHVIITIWNCCDIQFGFFFCFYYLRHWNFRFTEQKLIILFCLNIFNFNHMNFYGYQRLVFFRSVKCESDLVPSDLKIIFTKARPLAVPSQQTDKRS